MFSHRMCTRALLARRWLCRLSAAMFFFATQAWADDPAKALTLAAATRQAVAQAPLLQARRAQQTSAHEEAGRAGALPDPQLTVGIDNLAIQGPGAFTAGGDSMTMRTVGLSQVLPSQAKRQAQREAAGANVDQAASTTAMTRLAIEQQVAAAWITAWGAQHEGEMLQAMRREWAVDVVVAEARLRGGTGSAADVLAMH
ncbi:TolC family protein [Dyella silvatica]|uniref:TolC family protein n=1 Tax=Dyella silvatica TaxID=2992128 RepID=UPI002253E188|nr:TolC family protein [Dyella silvatica]